jgi:hypothetical protein
MKTTITMTPRAMAEWRSICDAEGSETWVKKAASVGGELELVCRCLPLVLMAMRADIVVLAMREMTGVTGMNGCVRTAVTGEKAVRELYGSMISFPCGWDWLRWSARLSVPKMDCWELLDIAE